MRSFAVTTIAVLGIAGSGMGQYRPGLPGTPPGYPGSYGTRPTTSPYLNLLGRNNPAANYYGIVRPQQQLQAAVFGGIGPAGRIDGEDLTDPELHRGTGHAATFNNLSHYYYNNPATAGMMGGGMGAARFGSVGGGGNAGGLSGRGGLSGGVGRAGAYGQAGGYSSPRR